MVSIVQMMRATWIRINDDKNQFGSANTTITGDQRVYGRVYVGTNGLGIVVGDIQSQKDISAPVINITSSNKKVSNKNYVLSGTVNEQVKNSVVTVKQNKKAAVTVKLSNGKFSDKFTLAEGKNTFVIEATDLAGNKASKTFTVEYKQENKEHGKDNDKNNKDNNK